LTHALFVFPFCIRILMRRDWLVTVYVGMVYLFWCAVWYHWLGVVYSDAPGTSGDPVSTSFTFPGVHQLFGRMINVVYLITWQHPLMLFFFFIAIRQWKCLSTFQRDLIFSIALSFLFYLIYIGIGGHGWGSRHSHGVLINFALLAAGMAVGGKTIWGDARISSSYFMVATAVGLFIILPLRSWQVHSFVGPYAKTDRYLNTIDADYIFLEMTGGYYVGDLVRNDPYLENRPVRIIHECLTPELEERFRSLGTCHQVDFSEIAKFGIARVEADNEMVETAVSKLQDTYSRWYDAAFEAVGKKPPP